MMEPMKYELEELLYQMGIYLVQAGYAVVVEAAALAVEEPERLQSLTQEFYPEVGRRCRCTWNCAERSLRTATAQAWECIGAGHAEDHPAAYGGRFPVHPTPRPAAEKEH